MVLKPLFDIDILLMLFEFTFIYLFIFEVLLNFPFDRSLFLRDLSIRATNKKRGPCTKRKVQWAKKGVPKEGTS
jgi:hypothetical protein